MNSHRKPILLSFGTTAGVLLMTGTAFACTTFQGRFTVTPSAPGSGSVTAVGNNSGMGYCGSGPSGNAQFATPGGGFSAVVARDDTGCNGSKLPAGLYTVTFSKGPSVNNNGVYDATINDCMNLSTNQLGTMVVDTAGNGSGSYTLTAPAGDAQICVSDPTGGRGNQVPVKVI